MFLFFNYFAVKNLQKEPFRLKLVQCVFLFTFYHFGLLVLEKAPACSKVQTVGNVGLQRGDPWKNEFVETPTLPSSLEKTRKCASLVDFKPLWFTFISALVPRATARVKAQDGDVGQWSGVTQAKMMDQTQLVRTCPRVSTAAEAWPRPAETL